MTTNEFDSKDTEAAYQRFSHDYEPEAINNAIQSLHRIGYTLVAPFINESHVKACDEIIIAFENVNDTKGVQVDNEQILGMSVLALTHMKRLDEILEIISDRNVTSPEEARKLLRLMKKISEPLR